LFIVALGVAVLVVEILNSAIEAVVDRISLERHPLAGRAKDLGSAAVFLTITMFVASWLLLAAPALYRTFAR
jgi:diacylglycerol kinase (ATP)